jgi:hypothetical protein
MELGWYWEHTCGEYWILVAEPLSESQKIYKTNDYLHHFCSIVTIPWGLRGTATNPARCGAARTANMHRSVRTFLFNEENSRVGDPPKGIFQGRRASDLTGTPHGTAQHQDWVA